MAGSVVEERVKNEFLLASFGGGRRRIGSVGRIEHAWRLARRRLVVGIGLCGGGRSRRCGRRQIERAFAPAAPEREHGRAQKDDGPSLTCRAVVAIHEKIPNAAAPYKDCPVLARPGQS